MIEWTGDTLIRRDGSTGKPIWDTAHPQRPWDAGHDPADRLRAVSKISDQILPDALVLPAPDLNRDGTGDLVWPIPARPRFSALSGKDGSLLWTDGAHGGPALPRSDEKLPRLSRIMGTPAMADVDGDGSTDLIAEFALFDDPKGLVAEVDLTEMGGVGNEIVIDGHRVVVAVSGRSGKELWNYAVDRKPTPMRPDAFNNGIQYVPGPNGPLVVVVAGTKWLGLDPATGRVRRPPIEFGFDTGSTDSACRSRWRRNHRDPRTRAQEGWFRNPDGSHVNCVLDGHGPATLGQQAHALITGRCPGCACGIGPWRQTSTAMAAARLLFPTSTASVGQGGSYGGIRVLDGVTGVLRWDCPLYPGMSYAYDSLIHLLAVPDLDADGTRDLIVVSRYSGRVPSQVIRRRMAGAEPNLRRCRLRQERAETLALADRPQSW